MIGRHAEVVEHRAVRPDAQLGATRPHVVLHVRRDVGRLEVLRDRKARLVQHGQVLAHELDLDRLGRAADEQRHKHGSKHVRLLVQLRAHQCGDVGNRLATLGHRPKHEIGLREMAAAADLPEYALRLADGNRVAQDKPFARRVPHVRQLRGNRLRTLRGAFERDVGRILELDGEFSLVEDWHEVRLDPRPEEHEADNRQRRKNDNRRLREPQDRTE